MTIFTDEYLKIEKADLDNHIGGMIRMPEWKFRALLVRLEAAEVIVDLNNIEHSPLRHDYEKNELKCEHCIAIKNWRKAAGK